MPDNRKGRTEELERIHQKWVSLNTWGTVINAVGLAGGLAAVHFWPMLSVAIVVSTIAIYAIFRALAGSYEKKMPFNAGRSPAVSTSSRSEGFGLFPDRVSVVYEARLERKEDPLQETQATPEDVGTNAPK